MIDERYIELMNDEIDGRNTPAQSEVLRSYLESDPQARRYFAEFEKSTRLLAENEEVAPPADMPQHIMDLIAESDARKQTSRAWPASRAWPESREPARRRRFGSFLRPAPAWAFAAGLALGLFALTAFNILWHGAPSPQQLRGDLSNLLRDGDELRGSPWHVEGVGFTGTITAHRVEGRLVVSVSGTAEPDTRFVLAHDGDLSGVAYRTLTGSAATLTTAPGRTTLAFAGTGDYVVELMGDSLAAAALTLRVESEGERQERLFEPSPP